MADHLIQEQRGQGEEYRRDTLQKYRNYVRDGPRLPAHRVPLAPQRGDRGGRLRQDADGLPHAPAADRATTAFRKWAARFYREYRGQAGLVRRRAEVARGGGGAGPRPVLRRPRREARARAVLRRSSRPCAKRRAAASRSPARSSRRSRGRRSLLDVPVVVQTLGKPGHRRRVRLEGGLVAFTVTTEAEPVALARRSRRSTSSACSTRARRRRRSARSSASRASSRCCRRRPRPRSRTATAQLIEGWRSDSHQPEIRTDAEVAELPEDRAVWLLGRDEPPRGDAVRLGRRLHARRADARGRPRVDAARRPLGGDRAPPPRQPREGDRLDLRRRHRAACPASAASCRTTASTRTSASRATSR